MVKYGIISDTHTENLNKKEINAFLKEIEHIFQDIDLIIHAGDIGSEKIIEKLKQIAPVKQVAGECDMGKNSKEFLFFSTKEFPNPIGIIHKLPEDLEKFCDESKLTGGILIYGHTHKPVIKGTRFNVLLLNPGSPTVPEAPDQIPGFNKPVARPSVMKLIIEDEVVRTFIINLKYKI